MLLGTLINIFGEPETFFYTLEVYRQDEMSLYTEDKGKGAFVILDEWISQDDECIYKVYGYRDGIFKNKFSEILRKDVYGDCIIVRYSPVMGRPVSIDEDEVNKYVRGRLF